MISLLCPTRHRRELFKRMVNSAVETADGIIEVVCYVDEDDNSYDDLGLNVKIITGKRDYKHMWDICSKHATGDIMGLLGDDVIFRTQGWDSLIEAEFKKYKDKILLVFGRDGNEAARDKPYGTHPFLHRRWVETVGYFTPPYFSADMVDTWLNDVAEILDRSVFIPEIYMEHMHVGFGKGKLDDVYQDKADKHRQDNPGPLYYTSEMAQLRSKDAEKLKKVML